VAPRKRAADPAPDTAPAETPTETPKARKTKAESPFLVVTHPDLDGEKTVSRRQFRVLERSGWVAGADVEADPDDPTRAAGSRRVPYNPYKTNPQEG
jgi:hypothetical protein